MTTDFRRNFLVKDIIILMKPESDMLVKYGVRFVTWVLAIKLWCQVTILRREWRYRT